MRTPAPFLPQVLDLEFVQLLAPERIIKQGGQNRAIADALELIVVGLDEEFARLMVAKGRGLAFVAVHLRLLDAVDGIVRRSCRQISEKEGARSEPVPERRTR